MHVKPDRSGPAAAPTQTPSSSRVSMLDLGRAHAPIAAELRSAFERVLESGRFILGHEVDDFEREVAAALGVEHAIACSSGTDALLVALMALDLRPGDEVLCPTFTFFATGGCVFRLGARPVFVDVSAATFNAGAEDFEPLVGPRTRAIIPVHLFGRASDMDPILELASRHHLAVIEDTAQAFGALDRGRQAGTSGLAGTFSFFPTKNLGGFGDGGLVVTADEGFAARIRSLRNHGQSSRYIHPTVGGNFRLDALQAALLRVKLPQVTELNQRRREVATRYDELFVAAGLAMTGGDDGDAREAPRQLDDAGSGARDDRPPIVLPRAAGEAHVFHQYVIRALPAGSRDALRLDLQQAGIETQIYYPVPLHLQPCFRELGYREGALPTSERLATQVLALPMHPYLTADEQERVVDRIASFFAGGRPPAGAAPSAP